MQFIKINENTSLSELSEIIGYDNIEAVLALNGLQRTPNIGKALKALTDDAKNIPIATDEDPNVRDAKIKQRKTSILNQCTSDSDVFMETVSLDEAGWNVMSYTGTFEGMLKVPEYITLPKTDDVLGNTESVSKSAYNMSMAYIDKGGQVDPVWFSEYQAAKTVNVNPHTGVEAFNWFNLPFGEITLYSSLAQDSIDFPCYPSEFSDGVKANYDTMPDMLYQYEPWQVYKGSGPRQCTFTFDLHRDMWTGNHEDGKCNELIRFCEACCYPEYNGAAVNTATVTMYIGGKALVSGIITEVTPNWDTESPIGHDGFYLHVKLSLTIVEISKQKLDYATYRSKGLIG